MNQYFVTIEAKFDSPRSLDRALKSTLTGAQPPVGGYFRNYAINATSLTQAKQLTTDDAAEPGSIISIESAEEIDVYQLDIEIARHFRSGEQVEIWYRSGRIYYPAES